MTVCKTGLTVWTENAKATVCFAYDLLLGAVACAAGAGWWGAWRGAAGVTLVEPTLCMLGFG